MGSGDSSVFFFSLAVALGGLFAVATNGVTRFELLSLHPLTGSPFLEQNQDLWQQHQLDP